MSDTMDSSKGLYQLAVTYSPVEDRLLLTVRTVAADEHRFWLTRRFVQRLWQPLMEFMSQFPEVRQHLDRHVREAVLSMRHQEAIMGANITMGAGPPPPVDGGPSGPRGGDGGTTAAYEPPRGPVVTGMTGRLLDNGRMMVMLQVPGREPFALTLDERLLHALCHLLIDATTRADWTLDLRVGGDNVMVPAAGLTH